MKAWCESCATRSPASFRPGASTTGEQFEDLCCDECHFVIATVSEREASPDLVAKTIADYTDLPWGDCEELARRIAGVGASCIETFRTGKKAGK
jgi:hypothetical protein